MEPLQVIENEFFYNDRLIYIPPDYKHQPSGLLWEDRKIFGNLNPISIEYCSGNGDWIVERAKQFPEKNWVAVEMRHSRASKILKRIKKEALSNLVVVCSEAWTFTRHYLPNQCIEKVFINFPDPWPKRRHRKNRLVQPRFLTELSRTLQRGGTVVFVTDDADYLQETLSLFSSHAHFQPKYPSPHYIVQPIDYGTSWFEDFWRKQGRDITYTEFMRI